MLMEIRITVWLQDGYAHREGNSVTHIKATLFGCSTKFIVVDDRLYPGTWQTFFFRTVDGLRERYAVCFQVTGSQQMDGIRPFAALH